MPALVEDQKFERYRINRWSGSGISGKTYEAEDTIALRKVALKLIHPWGVMPDAARRQFFRAMQSLSQVHHPYLTSLLDYGEHDGKLFAVRRYTTIGSLLSSEGRAWYQPPLPIDEALHYAHQLAQALDALHTHGCLHGSLTLSNIVITRGFRSGSETDFAPFLLSDAGFASFVRRFGQPQTLLLPITAAPEQLSRHETPASDQFALAVLLYFWLSGQMPYFGSTHAIENQKRTACIIPLRSLNPYVSMEQEAIIRRALAVHPGERFPSVLAFTGALLATLTAPTVAPAPEPEQIAAFIPESPQPPEVPERESEPVAAPIPATPLTATTQVDASAGQLVPTTAGEAGTSLPQPPRLAITAEGEEQRDINLDASDYTLGRAGADTIFLADSSVSRHHALLAYNAGRYTLSDQRSASGITVNGRKLTAEENYTLVDGDSISIGKYMILFRQG